MNEYTHTDYGYSYRIGGAILTCIHNLGFEQKYENFNFLTEIYLHVYSRKQLLFIAHYENLLTRYFSAVKVKLENNGIFSSFCTKY